MTPKKIILDENDMPKKWYNVAADLPSPIDPPIDPRTMEPVRLEALEQIFAKELIKQEVSCDRYITIPEDVRDVYRIWRPSPLIRAERLEQYLKTPAQIYYKWEGVSPAGSHKPNSAIPQAYFNMKEGTERIATETGAGQWGSAISFACKLYEIECKVYMVRASYDQKPYRKSL
ncbi:MAG: pyridoxal-phosphate dependent enzyme, partial [Candidatus Methanofastidiosa archaeon]|nr:pyridoxal-phosphate dependent enzyme [Candidatus Methanofastidiosa archaeon]